MSLPNIIKLSQTLWELWPAQDFSFRGDKYIRKKVNLSLLHSTISGPYLCLYPILSKYFKSLKVMDCIRIRLRNLLRVDN